MGSKNNHAELAKLLQKAKQAIDTGDNVSKRSTKELTNVKLDEHTIIGKDGIPIIETDQAPSDKTRIAE